MSAMSCFCFESLVVRPSSVSFYRVNGLNGVFCGIYGYRTRIIAARRCAAYNPASVSGGDIMLGGSAVRALSAAIVLVAAARRLDGLRQ